MIALSWPGLTRLRGHSCVASTEFRSSLWRGEGPAIHAFLSRKLKKDVDARHKAGHDEGRKL
jgi:hypothetical protein